MTCIEPSELDEIVNMHFQELGDDILPQMGIIILNKFYKYIITSDKEVIFSIRENQKIVTVCVVSFEPNTLMRRMILSSIQSVFFHIPLAMLRKPHLLFFFIKVIFAKRKNILCSPEITYIYSSIKGKGLGKKILQNIQSCLLTKDIKKLYVKTINTQNNRAIKFYLENGFKKEFTFSYGGKKYLYMSWPFDFYNQEEL